MNGRVRGFPAILAVSSVLGCGQLAPAAGFEFEGPVETDRAPASGLPPAGDERSSHSATLLADGSVLVAGGERTIDGRRDVLDSAELYSSSFTGFQPLPALRAARFAHTAVRLLDGRVLVAGGFGSDGAAIASTELFEPGLRAFVSGPDLREARGGHTATLLSDGRVLIAGGSRADDRERASDDLEIYDPARDEFQALGHPARTFGAANVALTLADGRVLLFWSSTGDRELFDPATLRFSESAPALGLPADLGPVRAATRLGDGSIAVFGAQRFTRTGSSLACEYAQALCEGRCIDVAADERNCGACGRVCRSDRTCEDGVCTCSATDAISCDGACVDPYSDPDHCGACEVTCSGGDLCVSGECMPGCPQDLTECDGICYDLDTDPEHCGSCGNACTEGSACWDGECICHEGPACNGRCVDFSGDVENCGGCGAKCEPGESCRYGECTDCAVGSSCGGVCKDLLSDDENCGGCGNRCSLSERCAYGSCQGCSAPRTWCGDECTDTSSDARHCGTCGNACEVGQCLSGRCQCSVPFTFCSGRCVNPSGDPENCGACGVVCPSGTCERGACIPACAEGEELCEDFEDYECANLSSDPQHCGTCFSPCPTGYGCWQGSCTLQLRDEVGRVSVTRVAGSLAVARSSSLVVLEESAPDVWLSAPSGVYWPSATGLAYGGLGHTATALPDGSLLMIGGSGTPSNLRLRSPWLVSTFGPTAVPSMANAASALMPDGSVYVVAEGRVFRVVDHALVAVGELTSFGQVLGVLPRGDHELLVVGSSASGPSAVPFDLEHGTLADSGLELEREGSFLPLGPGAAVIAGTSGLDVVRTDEDGTLRLTSLDADFRCGEPSLAKLPNGHVLVVGADAYRELDLASLTLTPEVMTQAPRCGAVVLVRPDGSAWVFGAGSSGASVRPVELYDSVSRTARTLIVEPPDALIDRSGWSVFQFFDRPLVLPTTGFGERVSGFGIDWQSNQFEPFELDSIRMFRRLPSGEIFASQAGVPVRVAPEGSIAVASPPPAETPPRLRQGEAIDFESLFPRHAFPGTAPEGSTGTTASSATNLPVPVWFPADGGWPASGTLVREGAGVAYRVPATPFPGLGLLFLSHNGQIEGLGPVEIVPSEDGRVCRDAGECKSGFCVEGVCCDDGCDGTCESCLAREKGRGDDGTCGPVRAGGDDDGCTDEGAESCGQNGTCDGSGECALYPDGTDCHPGQCAGGRCVVSVLPPGEGGAAGEPGHEQPGTAGTSSAGPTCNGDFLGEGEAAVDCTPYRCPVGARACLDSCSSNRDCAGGYACTTAGRCEPALNVTKTTGCACGMPGQAPSDPLHFLAVPLVLGLFRRWTSRRLRNAGAPLDELSGV